MGDYALRNPRRLKKVDKSHIDRLLGAAENQTPVNSGTPLTKKCKRPLMQTHSNDSVDLPTTVKNEDQNYKNQLIETLIQLHTSEWKGLNTQILKKMEKRVLSK